jgi:hypothetical protein
VENFNALWKKWTRHKYPVEKSGGFSTGFPQAEIAETLAKYGSQDLFHSFHRPYYYYL